MKSKSHLISETFQPGWGSGTIIRLQINAYAWSRK